MPLLNTLAGEAARGDTEQDPWEDAVSITFCSLVSTTDPLSCPDRNCLLCRIPNKIPFCKGKNPSFPSKRDPPFRFEEEEDAWSKDGHPWEGLRVGLRAAGAAQGWFVSLLWAQESR